MLLLPEAFAFIGAHYTETVGQAQPLDKEGGIFSQYLDLCREFGLWVSFGGIHEKSASATPDFDYNQDQGQDQG